MLLMHICINSTAMSSAATAVTPVPSQLTHTRLGIISILERMPQKLNMYLVPFES